MKKFICTVMTFVLILGLFVPASFAASQEDYNRIVNEVETTNAEIESLIDQAIKDVEELLRNYNQGDPKLEKSINKIIENLVNTTDKLAGKMIENAAKVGIEVLCEYVEVEIGNQIVLIDPLRVVGF